MRKTILSMLILVLCLSLFFAIPTVSAETNSKNMYYEIGDDTEFMSVDGNVFFNLPAKYYVKFIEYKGAHAMFEYNGVTIKAKKEVKNNLNPYEPTTDRPVPDPIVPNISNPTLRITLPDDPDVSSRGLYMTVECKRGEEVVKISDTTKDLKILNMLENANNDIIYLVADGNTLGYIKAVNTTLVSGVNIPLYPVVEVKPEPKPETPEIGPTDPDADIVAPVPDDTKKPKPTSNNIVRVVLIVSICILSTILVFLIFKPVRNKKGRYSVDSDEDYDRDDSYQDNY